MNKQLISQVFQFHDASQVGGNVRAWSILSSCSPTLGLPVPVVVALKRAIIKSNAFSNSLSQRQLIDFLNGTPYIFDSDPMFDLLPTLGFDMYA